MVIRKCDVDGESRIDWVKSLIVTGVFSGVILWAVQIAVNADKKADIALTKMDNLEKRFDKIDAKIDRIIENR